MKTAHPLWQTLRSLKGNQRACVVTEPLWAVPFQLLMPFASVYMVAHGLQDVQIGWIASLGLAAQFLSALFSGAIVDKYGRRGSLLVFGLICWSFPALLWAGASGVWMFAAAAFMNGLWRITGNSFACMIVEDGDDSKLVHVFAILGFMGLLAGFLSPIVGLFIDRFTLIPTIRVVYLAAFVSMTVKFFLQYRMAVESGIGRRRLEECKGVSLFALTFRGWREFIATFREAGLMRYVILMTLMTGFNIVQATFWPLFVTGPYRVDPAMLSVFPVVKAVATIAAYLLITPHIRAQAVRRPLMSGLGLQFLGLMVLILCLPFLSIWAVVLSAVCDALALAILGPLTESMMAVAIPTAIRARSNSLITAMIMLIGMPVGWIAGWLSQQNRMLPLVLNLVLLAAEAVMAWIISRSQMQGQTAAW